MCVQCSVLQIIETMGTRSLLQFVQVVDCTIRGDFLIRVQRSSSSSNGCLASWQMNPPLLFPTSLPLLHSSPRYLNYVLTSLQDLISQGHLWPLIDSSKNKNNIFSINLPCSLWQHWTFLTTHFKKVPDKRIYRVRWMVWQELTSQPLGPFSFRTFSFHRQLPSEAKAACNSCDCQPTWSWGCTTRQTQIHVNDATTFNSFKKKIWKSVYVCHFYFCSLKKINTSCNMK